MDTQGPAPQSTWRYNYLAIALTAVVLLLGILAFVEYRAATKARTDLNREKQVSYKEGQDDQKEADDAVALRLAESPFRSYKAPDLLGNFEVKFPKNWNAYLIQDDGGSTQVDLTLNPDFVSRINGKPGLYAGHVKLVRKKSVDLNKQFQDKVDDQVASVSEITVSGIKANQFRGKLEGDHDSIIVLIPVRDKTVIISTDDPRFEPELKQILAQAVIVP